MKVEQVQPLAILCDVNSCIAKAKFTVRMRL